MWCAVHAFLEIGCAWVVGEVMQQQPSRNCDGYEWALVALAATQDSSLVGSCMAGLWQCIHLAHVAVVGSCDGLVSALGLLILLLLLLLLQACSVAGAHWWYPPSLMTACLLLPPCSHAAQRLCSSCAVGTCSWGGEW